MVDEALPGDLEHLGVGTDGDLPHEAKHGGGFGDGVTWLELKGASGFSLDDLGEDESGLKW